MKNKKNIAMAMVAVSTLTTVIPIFANSTENKTISDVRVASGSALKENGKVYKRTDIYNTKQTKDRSDDTLKTAFKNVDIVAKKEYTNDSYTDEFVVSEKTTNQTDISNKSKEIEDIKTIIDNAKKEGAKVVVKNEAAKIVMGEFTDSKVTVEITNKGSQNVNQTYVFVGANGIVDDDLTTAGYKVFDTVFGGFFLQDTTLDLSVDDYFNINLVKALIERNKDKFDIISDESGPLNCDLDVNVYIKGSKHTENDRVISVKFKNLEKLKKQLIVNLPDVKKSDFSNHWAKDSIIEGMFKQYVVASPNFRPNDSITRAEFVKIINRMYNIEFQGEEEVIEFKDVDFQSWYGEDVYAALEAGYINGYETKTTVKDANGVVTESVVHEFKPNQPITRQEAARIIARVHSQKEIEDNNKDTVTTFADDKDIAPWADESVQYLKDKRITLGYEEGLDKVFKPNSKITRAEALVMLLRSLGV